MLVMILEKVPTSLRGELTRWNLRKDGMTKYLEVLLYDDNFDVNGADVRRASASFDQNARPCVQFDMTKAGSVKMAALCAAYLPDEETSVFHRLGIVFDDELIGAPNIMGVISDRGLITGNFTKKEVEFIAATFKASVAN